MIIPVFTPSADSSIMDTFKNICEATSQSHELDNFRPTHRKGKKLLAEKKRRARINNCLMQIRNIVCEGEEEKDTDIEKMEKAEILEKTLEVLTRLRQDYTSQSSDSLSTRKAMAVRYASGFSSCAEESIRYIQSSRLVPNEVKMQLKNHLRSIARRIETCVQDNPGLDLASSQQASSTSELSPLMPPERRTVIRCVTDEPCSTNNPRISSFTSDSETYFVTSPVNFSRTHSENTVSLSPEIYHGKEEKEYDTYSLQQHDNYRHSPQLSIKRTLYSADENLAGYYPSVEIPAKSAKIEHFPHVESPESSHYNQEDSIKSTYEEQYSASYVPSPVTFPMSSLTQRSAPSTATNSPIIFYSSTPILSNPPSLLSNQPIFSCQLYEPYQAHQVPSIIVQPINYLASLPVKDIQAPVLDGSRQVTTPPTSAIDLCAKRNDVQISPETMWRPW